MIPSNSQGTGPVPMYPNNNNGGSKKLLTAAAAIIIALLGTNAYLLYNKSVQSTQLEQTTLNLDESEKAKAELEKTIAEANASLDQMRTNNADLNKLIDEQKAQLASQRDKIGGLLAVKGSLNKAKDEIQKLKDQVSKYIAEITRLKDENIALSSKNVELALDKENLNQEVAKERTQKEEIAAARAELAAQKEKVDTDNKVLSKKVNAASVIKTDAIKVTTMEVGENGKEDKAKKSKNVNRVKICFKALANAIADAGDERFFVRIISPTGETLASKDSGGGKITVLPKNEQILYTTEDHTNYSNKETDVCMNWDAKNITLAKGQYEVEVYNKGYLCGKGTFKIKGNSWF
jgi:hypothetical protein